MRVEEIPKLKQQYEEHLVQDKQFWEEQEEERVSDKCLCSNALNLNILQRLKELHVYERHILPRTS